MTVKQLEEGTILNDTLDSLKENKRIWEQATGLTSIKLILGENNYETQVTYGLPDLALIKEIALNHLNSRIAELTKQFELL